MNEPLWEKVDDFINQAVVRQDDSLGQTLRASAESGLPPISVSPAQGKLLTLLAQLRQARSILEIGTLGGYSTICLARGLAPGGHLVTLELQRTYAELARQNIERAGLRDRVEIRIGAAADSLKQLASEGRSFDFIFIDADKASYPTYLELSLALSRIGTLIIADNVVRKGAIIDRANEDPNVVGVRRFYEQLRDESRLSATAIQTVGSKGYDGFALALVTAVPQ